jgi:hypothetical protein
VQSSQQTVSLYVDNSNFAYSNLRVFHFAAPSPSPHYRPIDSVLFIYTIDPGTTVYFEEVVSLTTILTPDGSFPTQAAFSPLKTKANSLCGLAGVNIALGRVGVVESSSNSLFDVLQTVWGMGTVCFTVLLMKVARRINAGERVRKETSVKADFRDNLGNLLSKVSTLRRGRHRKELEKARHYLKHPLCPTSCRLP